MSAAHSISSPTPSSTAPPRSTTLPHRNSASSSSTVTVTPPYKAAAHESTPTQASTPSTSVPDVQSPTGIKSQSTQPQTRSDSRQSRQSSDSVTVATRPQKSTTRQYVERIISPGSILFRYTEVPELTRQRLQTATRVKVPDMDRRHPSSFQQLEKVSP